MGSDVVLSAGVRQNLLALQSTAELMSTTQHRLATGKKVNSALDNPSNFFTSQSLSNRARDLNALLDSIGQAQKTLEAADHGITSLTKLVESAKSVARQARQAPQPGAVNYSAINVSGNPTDETLASSGAGGAASVANATTYSFEIAINGGAATTVSFTSTGAATLTEIINGLEGALNTVLTGAGFAAADANVVTNAGNNGIRVEATNADIDFVISNATSNTALVNNTYNSTSLFDNIGADGYTLGVAVNGGATQQITFGTGVGNISTLAELNTRIGTLSGVTGSANNAAFALNVASATTQNSITLTSSNAALTTALGIGAIVGTTQGTAGVSTPDPIRTSLQADYNNILLQIDALAGDASYNGINLLNNDDLKVIFNELGTSSLTINGVTFDSLGLGLTAIAGAGFQSDATINSTILTVDAALKTLRTQASAFGANLTTVQTRQEFTKNLIRTLETGADDLVLADTNEEGANMLALQTRQQLSTTALSLSAQADQAVLRLFG